MPSAKRCSTVTPFPPKPASSSDRRIRWRQSTSTTTTTRPLLEAGFKSTGELGILIADFDIDLGRLPRSSGSAKRALPSRHRCSRAPRLHLLNVSASLARHP